MKTAVETIHQLVVALEEARDALNGAPNTVGLHHQIDNAIAEGRRFDPLPVRLIRANGIPCGDRHSEPA